LAPYCIAEGQLKINRKDLITALIGGAVFASDIAVWNISLFKISATVSTLLANLAPLWVGLLSYLLFRKRAGLLFWLGTLVAILGMIVLVGYQHIMALQFNIGMLLALLASFLYAIYIIITKGVLKNISTITFMFYNMLAGSVVLLVVNLVMHNNITNFPAHDWLCFLGVGLICQLIGWITINYSLAYLDSTKVSVALLSQTVIAGFWAALFLNETLEVNELIGSAIVLAGIAITFLKKKGAVLA
jgi:drug/metabolite transporter (DMT)-like permease